MAGKFFIGNTSDITTMPKKIFVGNSSNVARTVQSIFVGNGSNQAVKVWPTLLPEGYQQVEYIRSVYRSNAFSTGIYANSNTRIVIDFEFVSLDFGSLLESNTLIRSRNIAAPFFNIFTDSTGDPTVVGYNLFLASQYTLSGSTGTIDGIDYFFRVCFSNGSSLDPNYDIYFYHTNATIYQESDVMTNIGNNLLNHRMIVDLNRSRGTLYINDTLVKTFDNTFPQLSNHYPIFLLSYSGVNDPDSDYFLQVPTNNKINLYSCQIYQNDVLVRNYIPCYNKNTYKAYLYDTVNENLIQCYLNDTYPPYLGPDV